MDTTKQYILMCEKAEEIQKEWGAKYPFDFIYSKKKRDMVVMQVSINALMGYWARQEWIWLPRQDQLQGMIIDRWATVYGMIVAFYGLGKNVDFNIYGAKATMEQLWLAFVMKEKYQKVWDGNKWVKATKTEPKT